MELGDKKDKKINMIVAKCWNGVTKIIKEIDGALPPTPSPL